MKSSAENTLYSQFLQRYPPQSDREGWRWVDSCVGSQTLVLLPGFMGEAETSFLYVLDLASHFRVISVSYPPDVGQINTLCESFCVFLDDLGIHSSTILGGSSSGFIAQAFLRRIPNRISACILTHTGLPSPSRAHTARFYRRLLQALPFGLLQGLMQAFIYPYFPRPTATHAFWRAHFHEVIRRQTKASLINRFALMDDFHSHFRFHSDELSGWPGKILLMEMRRDHLTTPSEQAALRALYPNAHVHIFADGAHYDSVEQPAEQIRVIRKFLESNAQA